MAIKVDKDTLTVTKTEVPSIYRVAGEATESTGAITAATKFYPFSVQWNINMKPSALAALVQEQITAQKPRVDETALKAAIVAAYPSNIVSMSSMRST